MPKNNQKLQILISTVKKLRGPGGCPWDQKQTNQSMVKYLKGEVEELVEGIESDDYENICEELGDILYIIIMLCEINEQTDKFTLDDVIEGIDTKLIRRHPHVFQGTSYKDEEELRQQWEKIKQAEKSQKCN